LDCELFEFSNERVTTGIDEIDDLLDDKRLDIQQFEFHKEDGEALLLEYYSESTLMVEDFSTVALDPAADNEDFDTNIDDILDFTERNPFGEVYR
jgi:hypothetical protein